MGPLIQPGSPLTDLEDETSLEDIPPLPLSFGAASPRAEDDGVVIIKTQFDPDHPVNKQPPFHNREPDFILEWTRKERKRAEKALVIDSVDILKEKVGNFGGILSLLS